MLEAMTINFKKLSAQAIMPHYATVGDAGADLYSIDTGIIRLGEHKLVSTGIAVEIPFGYVGLVHPRSGLATKFGITVLNTPGTIDAGYRGEILVNLYNAGEENFHFMEGDRIAQLVIQPVITAIFTEVEELSSSERNLRGFGSTGGFNG